MAVAAPLEIMMNNKGMIGDRVRRGGDWMGNSQQQIISNENATVMSVHLLFFTIATTAITANPI